MAMKSSGQVRDAASMRAAEPPGSPRNEASATEAVERALGAGERLVTEHIELARLDVEEALASRTLRAALVVVPALFAFGGWWVLMAACVAYLEAYLSRAASLAIVGGGNVVLGLAVVLVQWAAARGAPAKPHGARS